MDHVTRWLNASTASRAEEMFAGLDNELHKIARGRMAGERVGQTPEATGLVHEAWLRLQKSAPEAWRDRKQFYGAAAEAMRRILVEAARRRLAAKRGGGEEAVPLDDDLPVAAPSTRRACKERISSATNISFQSASEAIQSTRPFGFQRIYHTKVAML